MIDVSELDEENFSQFFLERCEELYLECQYAEKKLFYGNFEGNIYDITKEDISHNGLDYKSFLNEINERNVFLLSTIAKEDSGKYGNLFCSIIVSKSKKFYNLLELERKKNLLYAAADDVSFDERRRMLSKYIFSFQYIETNEYIGKKKSKRGLEMPVFGLPRMNIEKNGREEYCIRADLKDVQKRYGTYEILRNLITFEKMRNDADSNEHFFLKYLSRLINNCRKDIESINPDIQKKRKRREDLWKILKDLFWDDEKCRDTTGDNLKKGEYSDAFSLYESHCKRFIKESCFITKIEQIFLYLQGSVDLTDNSSDKKQFDDWNSNNSMETDFKEQYKDEMDNCKQVIQNELFSFCVSNYVKASRINGLNKDILTQIKQRIVIYTLSSEDILTSETLEKIKTQICNEFSSNEKELIHLYVKKHPLIFIRMQEATKEYFKPAYAPNKEQIKIIKKKYKEIETYFTENKKFPPYLENCKSDLAYFLWEGEYTARNDTHKSFNGELRNMLSAFKEKKLKKIEDTEFADKLSRLIDFRVNQIPQRRNSQ